MKKLIIMVGISGSGKSTLAKKLQELNGYELVSTDDIREEICGNAEDQSQNARVFQIARFRVKQHLNENHSCIIDATNLNPKDRKEFISIGNECGASVEAQVVNVLIEVAKQRNSSRQRKVPDWVIDKQYSKYIEPSKKEGIQEIIIN